MTRSAAEDGTLGEREAPLGLIAGNGRFPFLVAEAARRAGRPVIALAIREEAAPELEGSVDTFHWVGLGQFGRAVEIMRAAGVRQAVMAVFRVSRHDALQVCRAVTASRQACEPRSTSQAVCAVDTSVPQAPVMQVSAAESAAS